MTDIQIDDLISEELVKNAAFRGLPDELAAVVYDDDHIVQFYDTTKILVANIQAQLQEYNGRRQNDMDVDKDWRRRSGSVVARCSALLAELGPKVKDRNRRVNSDSDRKRSSFLYLAIEQHRATVREDYEPTSADVALWSTLDAVDGLEN